MTAVNLSIQGPRRASLAVPATMSDFWQVLWSLTLAIGWLLPNHYLPWSSFHFDAWAAAIWAVAALFVTLRSTAPVRWNALALLVFVLLFIPSVQLMAGIIVTAGNAWISSAYLLAFLLAVLTGTRWADSGEQATNALFLAIGVGAVASVGLQLHQWLGLGRLGIWTMGDGTGRPFANFGQPNQLATFLIWGLLAGAWAYVRGKARVGIMVGYGLFLLFGLSLTASRTAWIAIAILVVAAWAWRSLWPDRRVSWVVTGLAAYFAICVLSINWLSQLITGDVLYDATSYARISGESRPAIWSMFVEAAAQRPWLGYGWNQVGLAQVAVADDLPAMHVHFSQSHSLFLDLVLWCGVPVGLAVSAFLVGWMVRRIAGVRTPEQALLILLLLVVANHAMLELPLHYAYFLLPTGLVMGILESRQKVPSIFSTRRWAVLAMWAIGVALFALLVRDYWRVERSYETLRFEWAHNKTPPAVELDVLLLTQWRDYFRLVRFEPVAGMSDADLRSLENTASMYPAAGLVERLAVALAWNERPQDAARWLRRMCNISPITQCDTVKSAWAARSASDPRIAAVPWPE